MAIDVIVQSHFGESKMSVLLRIVLSSAIVLASAFAWAEDLKVVDSKKVCMVTDKLYSDAQIPVQVEGKTYYGCCDMCKERLASDPKSRMALDPVSRKPVDKSRAVIAVRGNGSVLYFESRENVAKYKGK